MIYFVGRHGWFHFVAVAIWVVLAVECAFASTASIQVDYSVQHHESHRKLQKLWKGMLPSMHLSKDVAQAVTSESDAHLALMMEREQLPNSVSKSTLPVSEFETKGRFVLVDPVNVVETSRRRLRQSDDRTKLNVESKVLRIRIKYWIVIVLAVVVTVCCSCDCRTFCCCCITNRKTCPDATLDDTSSFPSMDVAPPSSSSEATTATPPHYSPSSSFSPSDAILSTIMSPSFPLATIFEHHNEDTDESTRSTKSQAPARIVWVSPLAKRRARIAEEKEEDVI